MSNLNYAWAKGLPPDRCPVKECDSEVQLRGLRQHLRETHGMDSTVMRPLLDRERDKAWDKMIRIKRREHAARNWHLLRQTKPIKGGQTKVQARGEAIPS